MYFWKSGVISIAFTVASLTSLSQIQATLLPELGALSSKSSETNQLSHHDLSNQLHNINQIDAPKYYALNALLYKTPASSYNKNSLSTSDLRPRDGARLEPKTGGVERAGGSSSEESPIDDLISAMRRSKEAAMVEDKQTGVTYDSSKKAGTMGGSGSFGTDDEATIQRKSTNLDDDSELMSSRLRSKGRLISRETQ